MIDKVLLMVNGGLWCLWEVWQKYRKL